MAGRKQPGGWSWDLEVARNLDITAWVITWVPGLVGLLGPGWSGHKLRHRLATTGGRSLALLGDWQLALMHADQYSLSGGLIRICASSACHSAAPDRFVVAQELG